MVRFLPNKRSGCSAVRVRTLAGTPDRKAGIPLDQSGIRYADCLGPGFDNYEAVEIEFILEQRTKLLLPIALPELTCDKPQIRIYSSPTSRGRWMTGNNAVLISRGFGTIENIRW